MPTPYNDKFFSSIGRQSYNSARVVANLLFSRLDLRQVRSVLDVGCGDGSWLLGLRAVVGADVRFVGIDGKWTNNLNQERFFEFSVVDLAEVFCLSSRFDIVFCMEVAEHLPKEAAPSLVTSLTQHGGLIIFSAAIQHQGGEDHVNEQPQSYWIQLFNDLGYKEYFFPRVALWENKDIGPWYRQNILCFCRSGGRYEKWCVDAETKFGSQMIVNVVHPEIFDFYAGNKIVKVVLKLERMISRFGQALKARVKS